MAHTVVVEFLGSGAIGVNRRGEEAFQVNFYEVPIGLTIVVCGWR